MFKKCLLTATAITLIASLPLYFLVTQSAAINHNPWPVLLALCFVISLASALLYTRIPERLPQPRPRQRRQKAISKAANQREQGQVKWFNAAKGFGFITRDSGDDIFVHFRAIRGEGHRVLRDGQRVEFSVSESDKGLQAEDVAAIH